MSDSPPNGRLVLPTAIVAAVLAGLMSVGATAWTSWEKSRYTQQDATRDLRTIRAEMNALQIQIDILRHRCEEMGDGLSMLEPLPNRKGG